MIETQFDRLYEELYARSSIIRNVNWRTPVIKGHKLANFVTV